MIAYGLSQILPDTEVFLGFVVRSEGNLRILNLNVEAFSILGLSKKRWPRRLAKSQFSIFGIPRSVIMTIIGRLKTNKLARQNLLLWEPYEWQFLF